MAKIDTQLLVDSLLHATNIIGERKRQREDAVRQAQLQGILKGPEYAHDLELQRLRNQGTLDTTTQRGESQLNIEQIRNAMKEQIAAATNDTRRYTVDQNNLSKDRQIIERGDQSYRLGEQKYNFLGQQGILNRENKLDIVGQQQAGATGRTQITSQAQKDIASGNQAVGEHRITSNENIAGKKFESQEKIAKQKSSDYRYGIDKREAGALQRAQINNTSHLSIAKIAAEKGVEVARIAAKASTLNTLKRVQAQIRVAELRGGAGVGGGKAVGVRALQMKSWETELKEIARQVSDPKNYFLNKDKATMERLIQRRNAILDQVRKLEGDAPEADPNAPQLDAIQKQVFTPGPPNPPVVNNYRANPNANLKPGEPIHYTLPFGGLTQKRVNPQAKPGVRKQAQKPKKKKPRIDPSDLMNTLNQL